MIYSVRIDIATLFIFNSFFLLASSLFPTWSRKPGKMFGVFFLVINGMVLILSVCDNIYFTYTHQQITFDHFFLMSQSFTPKLLLRYIMEGWYWISLLAALFVLYWKVANQHYDRPVRRQGKLAKAFMVSIVILLGAAAKRGLGSRPFSPSEVLLYFHRKSPTWLQTPD